MALDVVWIELPGGQGGSSFTVDRNQASAVSGYFARLFAFKEKHEHDISGLDIETFRLFHSWLKDRELPPDPEDDVYQTEPWLSSTAHAWVLSRILEAPEFEHFCLRTFIKNCALAPFGPWGYVQDNTPPDSPIRRFSNHWIAWNVGILKRETTEFDGLEAKALASQADGYTGNPRLYKLAHWYSPCAARVNAACDHNPKIKEEREHLRPPTAKPPAFSMTTYAERGISLEVPGSRRGSQSTRPRSSRVSSSRQTRHSRISYESRPVSPASSDSSVSPRRRFWLRFASSLTHGTALTIILAFCAVILPNESDGVRSGTRFYSIFCVSCGILCSLLPKLGIPIYMLLALGDGIALAINTKSCCEMAESPVCNKLKALTIFVWLGIPISWWFRTAWGTNALISWRRR